MFKSFIGNLIVINGCYVQPYNLLGSIDGIKTGYPQ